MPPLTRPRAVTLIALVATLAVSVAAQIAGPPTASQGPRTGMIAGQVVDATTGAPLPQAIVQLTRPATPQPQGPTSGGRVMADEEGRFFFADLPAGEYYASVTKDGYIRGAGGQRRPWGESSRFTLAEGERRTDVTLKLWKYAVITGTVVDEAGEPVVGVAVRALIRNVVAGRVGFGNFELIPELVPIAITDDRGVFRMSQVQPGTYVVLVPSSHMTAPVSVMTSLEPYPLRLQLFWSGFTETVALGQPLAQQSGDVAMLTMSSVMIPPSPAARASIYRTTYYPSATTAAGATQFAIAAGEERAGIAIAMRPVPAVRVSGRLVTPDGSTPPLTGINLIGEAMADIITRGIPTGGNDTGLQTATALSDAAGRFTFLGVPPGDYVIEHASRFLSRATREGLPAYWVSQRISVGTNDVADLAVQLRPALRVEGRFEFRDAGGQPAASPAILFGVIFETPFAEVGQVTAEVDRATRTFATVAAGGRYFVRPYEGQGLYVQSVRAGDKDVTDRAFDLQSDTSFVVTYTNQPTRVSGTVKDARGASSGPAEVLVFPVDRQRWSGYGNSPRDLKAALVSAAGVYTFANLPSGDYHLIAVDSVQAEGWQDPKRLEILAARATRLTVVAGTPKTVDLTLETIR